MRKGILTATAPIVASLAVPPMASAATKFGATCTKAEIVFANGEARETITEPAVKSIEITAGRISGILASSKLPVAFETSTPFVCSVQGSTILLLQTGACSIVANQQGNDKYLAGSIFLFNDASDTARDHLR